jgi:hypothetical protein
MSAAVSREAFVYALASVVAASTLGCGNSSEPEPKTTPEPELVTATGGIGPVHAPGGGEDTYCLHRRLDNATAGYVRKVRGKLTDGSHHMIVYVSEETEEDTAPVPCGGFDGIFVVEDGIPGLDSKNIPIFIAQQPYVELALPEDDGVPIGFRVEAHQMLRIELHWYNTAPDPVDVVGTVELDLLPEGKQEVIESSFGFWGTGAIDIPPNSEGDTGMLFQRALTDTKAFAVTTHQHQRGTRMQVFKGASHLDYDPTPLADNTDWAEPPLEMLDPPLFFDVGEGLAYRCQWSNPTNQSIGFGESVDDEMCFLWLYYYPSRGFDICVHFSPDSPTGVCNHLVR